MQNQCMVQIKSGFITLARRRPIRVTQYLRPGYLTNLSKTSLAPLTLKFILSGYQATCVEDSLLILSGGQTSLENSSMCTQLRFREEGAEWQDCCSLVQGRSKHSMFSIKQKVYVVGGLSQSQNLSIEVLDLANQSPQWLMIRLQGCQKRYQPIASMINQT